MEISWEKSDHRSEFDGQINQLSKDHDMPIEKVLDLAFGPDVSATGDLPAACADWAAERQRGAAA